MTTTISHITATALVIRDGKIRHLETEDVKYIAVVSKYKSQVGNFHLHISPTSGKEKILLTLLIMNM